MGINITQMIAHDMKLQKEEPLLAPNVINLNTVPNAVFDFFINHIESSRNARQIKVCTFLTEESFVYTKSKSVYDDLTNTELFISITQELTKDLFAKTKSSGSRSDGALFFLLYKHNGETFFGIMKMDPNDGIQIDTTDFTLKVQENMLPNPKDKLHKCAFIKKVEHFDENVHLYILDRQQNKGEVSKFFLSTFLQAKEMTNDNIMTERVVSKLIETSLDIIPKDKVLNFQQSIDKVFTNGNNIDLDFTLESLIKPFVEEVVLSEFVERFKKELRNEHEDSYFQFVSQKEPTIIQYSNEQIKIEFPIEFLNSYVFIDDTDNSFTFRLDGIKLNKKRK